MPRLMPRPRAVLPHAVLILLVLGSTLFAAAQDVKSATPHNDSRFDIYGGYGYFHPVNNSEIGGHGYPVVSNPNAHASLTYFLNRFTGLQIQSDYFSSNQTKPYGTCLAEECSQLFYTAQAGPVFRLPLGRVVPYVHFLGGGERTNGPEQQSLAWGWGITGGGGIDIAFKHFAIRPLQADFQYGHVNHGQLNAAATDGGQGVLYNVDLSGGIVLRLGSFEPPFPLMLGCAATPPDIYPGDPITVSSNVLHNNPKKKLTFTWGSSGGNVLAGDAAATIDTAGLAPGTYTVSGHVSEGPRVRDQASCEASFVVKEFQPPTVTCSANPTTGLAGTDFDITATAVSPQNRPLTYTYTASTGVIAGSATTAKLSTAGLSPSTITVTCTVADDVNHTVQATADVVLTAPPAPPPLPTTEDLCSVSFTRDTRRPVRVDNEAKGCLDDIALTLNQKTDARLIIVGNAAAGEKPNAAAERTLNVRQYLTQEKGVDASRIELRTGEAADKTVTNTLVPASALFNNATTHPFDEKTIVRHGQAYGTPHKATKPTTHHATKPKPPTQ